jgi:hypothetical protein
MVMSVNARLKAIADEIRTLSGQTDVLSLDEMAENLKAIPKEGAKTITPSTEPQTAVEGGTYLTGDVIVNPIPGEYVSTTDATASADEIMSGETAYVNGTKVTGTFSIDSELSAQDALIQQIESALVGKAAGGSGGGSDLPDGYRRVDYIRFAGEQIVDTGIICNQNTKIQVVFAREKSAQHYLYGVASSDNTASVTAYLGGSWRFGNKSATKNPTTNADMIYSGLIHKNTVTITGSASGISGVNEFETNGTLLLGSCRSENGELGSPQYEGKIFFFSMWSGDEQVLKLVPVTDGNGVYRFWDIVGRKFHDSITGVALEGGNL